MRDLSRRHFMRLAVGSAVVGSASATLLLEACAPSASTSRPSTGATPGAATQARSPLPTYMPPTGGPRPDFVSTDPRITAGFNSFPREPQKSWTGAAPGAGGTLNVFMAGYYPPPTARDQNPTWQAIEKELNSTVNMVITPNADYATRIQVVMAGNDMPDVLHISGPVANFISNQYVQAQCADLTPFLAGDAARDYPNLAAIPGYAYRGAGGVFDNQLYGIPIHRYLPTFWFFKNTDIWDSEIGANIVPKDTDDFKKILQQLNRPQENRWAIGNTGPNGAMMYGIVSFLEMFGAPNMWSVDSTGKLIRDRETEQYKAAIAYMKDLIGSGLYPPDMSTSGDSRGQYLSGKYVVSNEAFGNGWNDMWRRGLQLNPVRRFSPITPFASTADGKPQHYLSGGTVAYNVVKKGSPERVKEILRIMNYLAVPFGTAEDLLLSYGLPNQDFTLDAENNPLPTQSGLSTSGYVPWQYIAHRPYVWHQAGLPGYAQAAFEAEQVLVGVGVADPTRGFHSATQTRKGVSADQTFFDGVADILFSRRPFGDYDQLVTEWRTNAGDQVRKEYLDEISAAV